MSLFARIFSFKNSDYISDRKREKALAGLIRELLELTGDSVVDLKVLNAVRKRGYALLEDLKLEKDEDDER